MFLSFLFPFCNNFTFLFISDIFLIFNRESFQICLIMWMKFRLVLLFSFVINFTFDTVWIWVSSFKFSISDIILSGIRLLKFVDLHSFFVTKYKRYLVFVLLREKRYCDCRRPPFNKHRCVSVINPSNSIVLSHNYYCKSYIYMFITYVCKISFKNLLHTNVKGFIKEIGCSLC